MKHVLCYVDHAKNLDHPYYVDHMNAHVRTIDCDRSLRRKRSTRSRFDREHVVSALIAWAATCRGPAKRAAFIAAAKMFLDKLDTGFGPWRCFVKSQVLRHGTHYEPVPHDDCTDPKRCDCECRGCTISWAAAKFPGRKRLRCAKR